MTKYYTRCLLKAHKMKGEDLYNHTFEIASVLFSALDIKQEKKKRGA